MQRFNRDDSWNEFHCKQKNRNYANISKNRFDIAVLNLIFNIECGD
jgi:hypothetical protein